MIGGFAVRDISAWLEGLGLGRYAKAFEDNEIDFESLPHLTEQMMEQLGLPIGPRAKLLAAISRLTSSPVSVPDKKPEQEAKSGTPLDQGSPQRRQITVMFCDLVDSTELASRLDVEDFRSLLQAYQRACVLVITRYGGRVSQYRGDGIEVYFGWPTAQEDAAERAVCAGLEVIEAVKTIGGPEALAARVGIGTGVVVIGEVEKGDPSKRSRAVGATPHVAARLQAIASPNSVVIAEATGRLISGRFSLLDLGPQNLEGIAEPMHAFLVRHIRQNPSRFHATRGALTPLVGRRTELALLQQRWQDAKDGEGHVVFVSGVPGVGKSRIVYELQRLLGSYAHISLKFQCLAYHTESALFPVIQQIQRLAGLNTEDSDHTKLDKIQRLVSRATNRIDQVAPFIADMLSIPIESRYAPLGLTSVQMKVQNLFVLADLLLSLSLRRPVFCLVEDAQWMDPSTQELLDLLVTQIETSRVLLVVTHRPEYRRHSNTHGNISAITISRLSGRHVTEMARLALGGRAISATAMKRIIHDSDSIPLFIEELARTAADSREIDSQRSSRPEIESSVPALLRDALMARLDRTPQARAVAQMAAAVGREFSNELLRRVSTLSDAELESALAYLTQSGIIQQVESGSSARYVFRHALLCDAAYESLLKSTRREIHARVGAAIQNDMPEVVSSRPELLAHHFSLAGDNERAIRYWLEGGRRARSRSANLEAISQFQRATELLQSIPDASERAKTELEIQLALGGCFIAVHGYSSDDTRKAFENACGLSVVIGEPHKEIQAIFGLWGHHWMRARHDKAIELGETLIAKAKEIDDPVAVMVGHRSLGSTLFTLGNFVLAREHLDRAIALGRETRSDGSSLSLSFAVDPRIAAQLMLAWNLWVLGYPTQANRNAFQSLELANERADPYTLAFAHYVVSAVQLLRGEYRDSLEHADQSLALSKEHRISLYELYSRFGRGCAMGKLGAVPQAITEIREGIDEARRNNLGYMRGFMLGSLAEIQLKAGDQEAALLTIEQAINQVNSVSGRAWEAELARIRGDILLVACPEAIDKAEQVYEEAISIARDQRAQSLELRATTSLARFLQSRGRNDEARRRLSLIFDRFTEGFDTADLKESKALLHELE
jgi:class 3 adenylate cyclase/tetratricopeptide (TPR) repeat protein